MNVPFILVFHLKLLETVSAVGFFLKKRKQNHVHTILLYQLQHEKKNYKNNSINLEPSHMAD